MTDAETQDIRIPADDGYDLAATVSTVAGSEDDRRQSEKVVVVVGSATAVPRSYYARFARFITQQGVPVVTFDYRGIGGSRPASLQGFPARMRDWGEQDIPGVLSWTNARFPDHHIHWIGHSYGGFGTGLAHNNHLVRRQLGIATMTAHWKMMAGLERYRVALLMGYVAPPFVRALGYFPGVLMGSEDLPRDVFLEWAHWVMTPHFLFGDETLTSHRHFATLKAPMRFAQIEDDLWVTDEGVRHLMGQWPAATERSIWHVTCADAGGAKIGHLGFFRAAFHDTLWPKAAEWLLATDGA